MVNLGKESPCYKIVEIDLNYIDKVRHQMPLHNSFRSDLYLQIPFVLSINIFYLFSFNISLYLLYVTGNIEQEYYMFGENIKLSNGSVFLETQFCIGFVNISPIVPGRKYMQIIFNTLVSNFLGYDAKYSYLNLTFYCILHNT